MSQLLQTLIKQLQKQPIFSLFSDGFLSCSLWSPTGEPNPNTAQFASRELPLQAKHMLLHAWPVIGWYGHLVKRCDKKYDLKGRKHEKALKAFD
jgi:hypothetical protein